MGAALARDSWNITVRHAQEVVEFAVKGVLCYLCIDYPKVHDAADLLVAALTARQMSLSEEETADPARRFLAVGRTARTGVLLRVR